MSNITLFFAALLGLASWLAPNHYLPWLSFHSEALMAGALLLAFAGELGSNRQPHHPLPTLTVATLIVAAIPLLQALAGQIHFAGDAWMVFAYLLAFAAAQVLGRVLARRIGIETFFERLGGLFAAASVVCVGIQLCQWQRLSGLGLFILELAPGFSPYANVGQPNHLATMLFLGLVGVVFLYERRRIQGWVAALTCGFLEFGLVMTGSRTAWLMLGLMALGLWIVRRRAGLRIGAAGCVGLGALFFALLVSWGPLNDLLLLPQGRTFVNQTEVGPRPLLWSSTLHAIWHQPWLGYGWNQGLVAQSRIVDAHPANGYLIQHSHNLILDLMLWNGVVLGLALVALLVWWFWKHLRANRSAAQTCLLVAVGGVFLHAMLEYPLSYFYFLVPAGLMMGALDSVVASRVELRCPRWALGTVAALSVLLMGTVVFEYAKIETNMRTLRFEVARIGTGTIDSKAPDLLLLTQVGEFLRFSRVEAHPGMTQDELAWMLKVVERYPFAAGQLTTAVAYALNGQPDAARDMLAHLCHQQTARRCDESLRAWKRLAESRYPQLATIALPGQR